MARRWKIMLIVCGGLVLAVVLAPLLVPVCHHDCEFGLRVRGRVLDSTAGDPVAGAWVMSLPVLDWGDDRNVVRSYKIQIADHDRWRSRTRKEWEPEYPSWWLANQCGGATTDKSGRLDFFVRVGWSYNSNELGIAFWSRRPPPRHGIEALRIELPDRSPVVRAPPGGTWTKGVDGDDLWATWDLGDITVDLEEWL